MSAGRKAQGRRQGGRERGREKREKKRERGSREVRVVSKERKRPK